MQQNVASPVWLLLRDGQLIAEQFGGRSKEFILAWIEKDLYDG
jgi:hypothetical protein